MSRRFRYLAAVVGCLCVVVVIAVRYGPFGRKPSPGTPSELPGMDPKDIDVAVNGNVLSLRGERKKEDEEKGENFHRIERSYGAFARSIRLPVEVDANKVKASYKDGVLNISLPKAKETSTKKIEVKAV